MPPIFGLFILGIAAIGVAAISLGLPAWVALSPKLRRKRSAWIVAAIPTLLLVLSGATCAFSNARETALAAAVESGDAAEVRRLLDAGVTPDARTDPYDPYGSPYAIHRAIDAKRWDIVRLLIDHGATDAYYGDDTLYEQSAAGLLEEAGQKSLANRLKRRGPAHF